MTSTLGYYNKDGFPRKHLRANICAICGVAATESSEGVGSIGGVASMGGGGGGGGCLGNDGSYIDLSRNGVGEKQQQHSQNKVFQLACRHIFHEECIRGWCLIGKKDICPYWYAFNCVRLCYQWRCY